MSSTIEAPKCESCGHQMLIHHMFIGLDPDGKTWLCFFYTCDRCAKLSIPSTPQMLKLSITMEEMAMYLKIGFPVHKAEE